MRIPELPHRLAALLEPPRVPQVALRLGYPVRSARSEVELVSGKSSVGPGSPPPGAYASPALVIDVPTLERSGGAS